jgi:fatty-acyl-CoA synthase
MTIRLAFSNLACPAWSITQTIDAATHSGYDGLELRLLDGEVIDPARDRLAVHRAIDQCRAAGLEVCALDTSCRFNLPDSGQRADQIEEARRWITLAQETRVGVLRVFGGADQAGVDPEAANGWVASALAAVAPEAEAAGVAVALETHDGFASARRVRSVLQQVPSPAIGALWDSHHPYRMGEQPEEVLALLGARVRHVHVKDARHVPGGDTWDLVLLGEGEVPVQPMLAALVAAGYSGWISVEWEKKWHPDIEEPEIAVPQQSIWLHRTLAALGA